MRGLVQVTGRINYQRWSDRLGRDFVGNPEAMEEPGVALTTLVAGMRDGVYTGARLDDYVGGNQQDFINARRVVNGLDRADLIAGYAQDYLSNGTVDRLMAVGGAQVPTKVTQGPQSPAAANSTPMTPEPVFKGAKLTVEVTTGADRPPWNFVFYHQGTGTDQDGLTRLTGQGIRWVLNRRRRNESFTEISLKQLAERVAKEHGLKMEWLSPVNPDYAYVDQSGLSDYQLLLREAEEAGLFIGEANGTLTVKALDNLQDTELVLQPGFNLISWKVEDRPVDINNAEASSLEPQAPKYDIDPITGQFRQAQADVDTIQDPSATGASQGKPTGALKPGQDAVTTVSRQRVKRVKGLPATFVTYVSEVTLGLQPLDAVRTTGLPGVLSRVWLVDSVTHDLGEGTTTIAVYSPVEALDTTPAALAPGAPPASNPGGYIYPTKGSIVTDVPRWRSATRYHYGFDLAGALNDPTFAMQAGTVVVVDFEPSGWGNYVEVRHPDGYQTLYAHLNTVAVSVGQQVTQGFNLGGQGTTGGSTGIHLHVEIKDPSGSRVDFAAVGLRNPVTGDTV